MINFDHIANVRFWVYPAGDGCDNPTKITLKPGQRLTHYCGGPTDEGWSSSEISWKLSDCGKFVTCDHFSDGSDCDGRLSSGCETICQVEQLRVMPGYYAKDIKFPYWVDVDEFQRDYNAEAAGY